MLRRLIRALVAVLAGNAIYFLGLTPRLPDTWQHRPFAIDRGLLLDFVVCLLVYAILGALVRRRGD